MKKRAALMAMPVRNRKQQAAERAALIALLGWAPETTERYCATTGELWQSVCSVCGAEAADACRRDSLKKT